MLPILRLKRAMRFPAVLAIMLDASGYDSRLMPLHA